MPRKTSPEKDPISSPASPAAARSRRAATSRTQHPAKAADSPAMPDRDQETPARAEAAVAVDRELSHEQIARLAYALWEARGCQYGNPEEDWLRAEQELRGRALSTAQ